MIVGNLPQDLGPVDVSNDEMMFWMYLPISVPGDSSWTIPGNLIWTDYIVAGVDDDEPDLFHDSYVYLTVKTLYVTPGCMGQRSGWHCDGFLTEDLNYIWYDRVPTLFYDGNPFKVPDEHEKSMDKMRRKCALAQTRTYDSKHLLKLDQTVVHHIATDFGPGMRSFVKVSISDQQYNLKGNSVNHDLPETHWPLVDRFEQRNHPQRDYK